MEQKEVIRKLCELQAEVVQSGFTGGYKHSADCFCYLKQKYLHDYRNEGIALKFIEDAVREKIKSLAVKEKS